jgi:predicted nucleic acid-binding protein
MEGVGALMTIPLEIGPETEAELSRQPSAQGVTVSEYARTLIEQAGARKHGRTLAVVDGIIPATASDHGLILVTRSSTDFANLGVNLHNPREP